MKISSSTCIKIRIKDCTIKKYHMSIIMQIKNNSNGKIWMNLDSWIMASSNIKWTCLFYIRHLKNDMTYYAW